jgi:hypothetical protein
MMFNPKICQNCNRQNPEKAWLRTDFRGIFCEECRTNEILELNMEDLRFIQWTRDNSPGDMSLWQGKIDRGKLARIFKKKIEYHGEFALKSTQYLPEFK